MFVVKKTIKNKLIESILIALLLGISFYLMIVTSTIYKEQSRPYDSFKEMLASDGTLYVFESPIDKIRKLAQKEEAIKDMHYITVGESFVYKDRVYNAIAYDEALAQYKPDLEKGVWLNEVDTTDDVIDIVLLGESNTLKCGDYFEGEIPTGSDNDYYQVKMHVCGVVANRANYVSLDYFSGLQDNGVFGFYSTNVRVDSDSRQNMYLVLDSDFNSNVVNSLAIVEFNRNLSTSEKKEIVDRINAGLPSRFYCKDSSVSFKMLRQQTEAVIESKVITIIPVLIGFVIVTSFAIISLSAINTISSIREYATLYICGIRWSKMIAIQLMYTGILCAMGGILCSTLAILLSKVLGERTILFELDGTSILLSALLAAFMIVISCIMPFAIMKKSSPTSIIKEHSV